MIKQARTVFKVFVIVRVGGSNKGGCLLLNCVLITYNIVLGSKMCCDKYCAMNVYACILSLGLIVLLSTNHPLDIKAFDENPL